MATPVGSTTDAAEFADGWRQRRRMRKAARRSEAEAEAVAALERLAPMADARTPESPATPRSLDRADTTRGSLLVIAYIATAAVWGLGALWSFTEQTRGAASLGFEQPWVLPVLLDGLGVALALVAVSAALDARSAVLIRLGVVAAIAGSGYFNVLGVLIRWDGAQPLWQPITMALVAPVSSNLALEVLLSATRRHVQRLRGLPPPIAVPAPHPVRLLSAPIRTVRAWRQVVLVMTDPRRMVAPNLVTALRSPADRGADGRQGPGAAGAAHVRPAEEMAAGAVATEEVAAADAAADPATADRAARSVQPPTAESHTAGAPAEEATVYGPAGETVAEETVAGDTVADGATTDDPDESTAEPIGESIAESPAEPAAGSRWESSEESLVDAAEETAESTADTTGGVGDAGETATEPDDARADDAARDGNPAVASAGRRPAGAVPVETVVDEIVDSVMARPTASAGALRESALVRSGSPRIADLVVALAQGHRLSQDELQARYGVNPRTGKRYMRRAETVLAELRQQDADQRRQLASVGG